MGSSPFVVTIAVAVATFIVGYLIAFVKERLRAMRREREIGKKAVDQSRSAIKGQVTEQLVPLLPDFPYDLADARFLGKPVDYIIFKGINSDSVSEVVFLEVKTGNAGLTARERSIRDAIQAGRIGWAEYRLPSTAPLQAPTVS